MKGLEALERLKKGVDTNLWDGNEYDDLDLIEKELKGYERMLKVFGLKELANTENKLKALEIIKNKRVNILWFIICNNINEYNNNVHWENAQLTQEEFNLLKEVLL